MSKFIRHYDSCPSLLLCEQVDRPHFVPSPTIKQLIACNLQFEMEKKFQPFCYNTEGHPWTKKKITDVATYLKKKQTLWRYFGIFSDPPKTNQGWVNKLMKFFYNGVLQKNKETCPFTKTLKVNMTQDEKYKAYTALPREYQLSMPLPGTTKEWSVFVKKCKNRWKNEKLEYDFVGPDLQYFYGF